MRQVGEAPVSRAEADSGRNGQDLKPKTPPTLAIDVNDRFAWMRLVVALAWGGEPRKMDRALATYSPRRSSGSSSS